MSVVVTRLARFASSGTGRINASEKDCYVYERSDPHDGTRNLAIYLHSAQNDWNTIIRDPALMNFFTCLLAVNTIVTDYLLGTQKFSMVSGEYISNGTLNTKLGWGDTSSTTRLNTAVTWGQTAPGPNFASGLGAATGKVLLVGYSMGGLYGL